MKADPVARQGRQPVSVQAHIAQRCEGAPAPGRNHNRLHVQKALMAYLFARPDRMKADPVAGIG